MLSKINDAVIAITYRCNARCRMCNIWQKENHYNEISPEVYNMLPRDLLNINITGGEPFLREDLVEIVKVIVRRCPDADVIISTNGFAVELVCSKMKKILEIFSNISVAVSLDGIGNKHNEIRGVERGYNKVLMTITSLKAMGVKNLKVAFTLGNYNVKELQTVYELSRFFGLEFSLAVVHSGENYFSKYNELALNKDMINILSWVINKELQTNSYKRWARAYFAYGILKFLENGRRILPDYSGKLNIFIDPCGNIYPNNVSDKSMGQLWRLDESLNFAHEVNTKNWMMCTARAAIKKHWMRAGWWVLWNK
ncbi:MAG: radical SAM protein [bacterium]